MTLAQIIDIFKDISVKHPEINSFYTGLNFEHNNSNIVYPALRLVFPYDAVLTNDNQVINYTFDLTLYVNDIKETVDTSSKYENTNFMVQNNTGDESLGNLVDENLMRDRALGIAAQVLQTIEEQEQRYEYFSIGNPKLKALERANNDFVTGVSLKFTVTTDNCYRCAYPNLLDDVN